MHQVQELRSRVVKKIWLSMRQRNFDSDKNVCPYAHPFMLAAVKCHIYQPVVQGSKQPVLNLMIEHYLKKRYPLTSVT